MAKVLSGAGAIVGVGAPNLVPTVSYVYVIVNDDKEGGSVSKTLPKPPKPAPRRPVDVSSWADHS